MEQELWRGGHELVLQDTLDLLREITLARLSATARDEQAEGPRVAVGGLVQGGSGKTSGPMALVAPRAGATHM